MPNARMIHAAASRFSPLLTPPSKESRMSVLKKVFLRQLSVYPCLRSLYEFIGCENCSATAEPPSGFQLTWLITYLELCASTPRTTPSIQPMNDTLYKRLS